VETTVAATAPAKPAAPAVLVTPTAPAKPVALAVPAKPIAPVAPTAPAKPSVPAAPSSAKSLGDRLDFAKGLYARDMYDMALEEYNGLLQDAGAKEVYGEALLGAGESLFFLKRYSEAREKFKIYQQKFADAVDVDKARQRIGETLLYQEQPQEAFAVFHELRSAKSDAVRIAGRYYEGKISFDQGYLNAAAAHFKEVLDSPIPNPYTPYARYYSGEVLLAQDKAEEADKLFEEAAKTSEPDVKQLAWMGSGKALTKANKPAEAAKFFKQAYESDANQELSEDALLNYMSALVNSEQFEELAKATEQEKGRIKDPKKRVEFKLLAAKGLSRNGQKDAAQGVYQEVMKAEGLKPEDTKAAKLGVTQNMIAQGQAEQAMAFLDSEEAKQSLSADEIAFLRAEALKALGRTEDALAAYEKIAGDPQSGLRDKAALARAYLFSEHHDYKQAADAFRAFLKAYPDTELSTKAFSDLILVEVKLKEYPKAIEDAHRFLDRYPAGPESQKVHLRLAGLYTEAGQFERASETYDNHVRRFSDSVNPKEIAMLRAANAQRSGDTRGALKIYLKISRKDVPAERYAELLKNRAFGYVTLSQYRSAAAMYLKLFRDFPAFAPDPEPYLWTADIYAHSESVKKLSQTVGFFEKKFGAAGHEDELAFYQAEADRLSGRLSEAVAGYDRVLEGVGPLSGPAALGKGLALAKQGNGAAAEDALEDALKLAGDNHQFSIRVRMKLGQMYQDSKNYKEAAKTFFAVAILYDEPSTVPQALWGAGQAFEKAKDTEKATQAYRELLERYPKHSLAGEANQRLKALSR
jgi:tetratricopeptide (TPR) repeat protein